MRREMAIYLLSKGKRPYNLGQVEEKVMVSHTENRKVLSELE